MHRVALTAPARVERLALLVAGSVGAGVHAGLAPEHLGEWLPLGVSFVAAATLLSLAVLALALRPADGRATSALAVLLVGIVAAYAATRFAALPPLDPEREPLDWIGLGTTAVETAGLILAIHLSRGRPGRSPRPIVLSTGGTE